MANEISLDVNDDVENHRSQAPTIRNNDALAVVENKKLFVDLEVETQKQRGTRRDLASDEKPQTKIQKVPKIMLQYEHFFKDYYKPKEVAIGPIHAHCDNLSKRELKIKLAVRFIERSGKTQEKLLGEIKAKIGELRKCFDENVISNPDGDKLSRLLFLDGCFLLQFVESHFFDSLKDFDINDTQASVISNDLLLAENQIPSLVIKILTDLCEDVFRNTLMDAILIFVARNVPIGYPNDNGYLQDIISGLGEENKSGEYPYYNWDVQHWVNLLDLLRGLQILGVENIKKNKYDPSLNDNKSQTRASGCLSPCFKRIKRLFGPTKTYRNRSFRNVQELKQAGIQLRPSGTDSLNDISFSTKYFISGQLKLPAFVVDNSTALKLLNLVAYEMCMHNYENKCTVTSYINFLDLLIDTEEDVKDLRAAHVLRNRLSNDADVAKLINNIGDCCRTAPKKDSYSKVKDEIQRHYERKTAIWMAQVYNNHFKSPWTVIALLAASMLLIFTAIQTWYDVHSE